MQRLAGVVHVSFTIRSQRCPEPFSRRVNHDMIRPLLTIGAAGAAALALAGNALAFDCAVANKPATAGAVAIEGPGGTEFLKPNPGTEDQPHGAFFAFTDGEQSASTFLHAPGGVLPPVREGGPQQDCDGKGLESLEVCFGGE
jgi:hypothetical protein